MIALPTKTFKKVLVTGASGYVGSHTVKTFLEAGYLVRGSVRSLKNAQKVQFLYNLAPEWTKNLELVEADLLNKTSWDLATRDCDAVLHVASAITLENLSEQEFIRPAVEGTLNVLNSSYANKVKKVVIVSSMASLWGGNYNKILTEDDWSDESFCSSYEKSKLRAERAAWDFWRKHKGQIEIAVINPGFITGPTFNYVGGASEKFFADAFKGAIPMFPQSGSGVVDVRDVALALMKALENPNSDGQRYICLGGSLWFKEMFEILRGEFLKYGYKITKREAGKSLVRFGSYFDSRLKLVLKSIGTIMRGDTSKIEKELGMKFRPLDKSLIEMGYSLIELGAIPDKTKGNKKK